MRFKRKKHPKIGDKRTIKKFLLFPLTINYETRWLEVAEIKQRFERVERCYHGVFGYFIGWQNTGWGNENTGKR